MLNHNIFQEIKKFEEMLNEIEKSRNTILVAINKLQKNCNHPIVIHNGTTPFDKGNFGNTDFRCPQCGATGFNVERNDGKNFIIEATNFKGQKDPELCTQKILNIYNQIVTETPTLQLNGLITVLKSYGIKIYNGTVLKS